MRSVAGQVIEYYEVILGYGEPDIPAVEYIGERSGAVGLAYPGPGPHPTMCGGMKVGRGALYRVLCVTYGTKRRILHWFVCR
jgi:hypothetical protein